MERIGEWDGTTYFLDPEDDRLYKAVWGFIEPGHTPYSVPELIKAEELPPSLREQISRG